MFFVGTFELTIDSKNRLSIPHPIRSKLNPDTDGRAFYIVPGYRPGTLSIYPEKYFERIRGPAVQPEELSQEAYEWRQFEFSQSALVDPDTQGRVLIPDRLLKRAGIGREVVLIGVQDHLELWSRKDFEEFESRQWPDYPERRAKALKELRARSEAQAGISQVIETRGD